MATTRSGYTLLKVPQEDGSEGPPPFEVPDKSLPYWLGKGMKKVSDDEVEAISSKSDIDLSKLGREELEALASSKGLDPSTFKSKGDLVNALQS